MFNPKKKGLLSIILGMILFTLSLNAGEYKLSLEDVLRMAREKNYDIKLAGSRLKQVQSEYLKTYSNFLPGIKVSEVFVKTNEPLNAFGLKLKQEIISQSDFNPLFLNDPDEVENFTTKLEFQQPVFNLDGFYGRKMVKSYVNAAKEGMTRTHHAIEYQVKMTYHQLLLAKQQLDVINQSIDAARSCKVQSQNFFKQGIVSKADFLMVQVRLTKLESDKLEITNSIHDLSDRLKFLVNLDTEDRIEPVDSLSYLEIKRLGNIDWVQINSILEERSDMKARQHQINAARNKVKMSGYKFVPNFNLFGHYELNEEKLFKSGGDGYLVGAALSWNIFKGLSNIGEMRKSRAELENTKIEYEKMAFKNRMELVSAYRNLEFAVETIALAKQGIDQSEESFRIIKDRYEKGLEKITDYLTADVTLEQQRLNYYQALFNYTVKVFHLEFLLETQITGK